MATGPKSQKFYFANSAAPYSPATYRGAWDSSASIVDRLLHTTPSGAAATKSVAETSATNNYDVMLGRWVSAALAEDQEFSKAGTTDTATIIIGARESGTAANAYLHYHIYITTGDSDTVRGTIATDYIGASELTTTARGWSYALNLSNVIGQVGDRIVIEVGWRGVQTSTTSYNATINYGNTGTTDLTNTSTSVTTRPGNVVITYTKYKWEQEGYRFRYDSGNEATPTWIAAQDTNINVSGTNQVFRLRTVVKELLGVNPPSRQFQLNYKKSTDGIYTIVGLNDNTVVNADLDSDNFDDNSLKLIEDIKGKPECFLSQGDHINTYE
jgi:hypothetical protein